MLTLELFQRRVEQSQYYQSIYSGLKNKYQSKSKYKVETIFWICNSWIKKYLKGIAVLMKNKS